MSLQMEMQIELLMREIYMVLWRKTIIDEYLSEEEFKDMLRKDITIQIKSILKIINEA